MALSRAQRLRERPAAGAIDAGHRLTAARARTPAHAMPSSEAIVAVWAAAQEQRGLPFVGTPLELRTVPVSKQRPQLKRRAVAASRRLALSAAEASAVHRSNASRRRPHAPHGASVPSGICLEQYRWGCFCSLAGSATTAAPIPPPTDVSPSPPSPASL